MIKHDAQFNEAIQKANDDFRRSDGLEMVQKCPYLFSSNMADAYWITANSLYCTGQVPRMLHKSRGYNWKVDFPGVGLLTMEVTHPDHRIGVIIK